MNDTFEALLSPAAVYAGGRLSPRGIAVMRGIFSFLFRLLTRIEVRGLENVPPPGQGLIIAPNHLSAFDPPLIFVCLPPRPVAAFAGDTHVRNPFFRWVLESAGVIWVNRGETSPSVVKAAIRYLRSGRALGVAPEGKRSRTGGLQAGKTGAVMLAYRAGVPILPVAITGTEKMKTAFKRLRRQCLTVTFGRPLVLPPPCGRHADAGYLDEQTTELMCRLAALLPPEYRGVYAEHPRLKELLVAGN